MATRVERVKYSSGDFIKLVSTNLEKIRESVRRLKLCVEGELFNSLGRPGEFGDPLKILTAVNNMFSCFLVSMSCERDMCSAEPPSELKEMGVSFEGITRWAIEIANAFRNDWVKNVEDIKVGSNQFIMTTSAILPPQLEKMMKELNKLQKEH